MKRITPLLIASLTFVAAARAAPSGDEADDSFDAVEHGEIDEDALYRALEARPASGDAPVTRWPRWDHRSTPDYLELVRSRLAPRDEELAALARDGFVVLMRDVDNPARAYHTIYTQDMPVFVTMDSLFHALAAGQEAMGAAIERRHMLPRASLALQIMHEHLAATARDWPMAAELDGYLAVARSLLAGAPVALLLPHDGDATATRDAWLARVMAAQPDMSGPLFGRAHPLDLSLATPRARYAGDPELERWFRGAYWLTQIELNLVSRDCRSSTYADSPDPSETPDEAVIALALAFLADESGALDLLTGLSDVLDDLVAPRVDVAPDALLAFAADAGIDHEALVSEPADELQRRLALAIGTMHPRTAVTHIMPSSVDRMPVIATLLGVRPTEGTEALAALIQPHVPGRKALDGLDVAYALGHDRALAHLRASPSLAAGLAVARRHMQGTPALGTLRLAWLHAVLALAEPSVPSAVTPTFMTTPAFADQRINSAVGAYAQLRHAHVLYESQSFSVGGCDVPDGFVEPAPAVLAALRAFAARGQALAGRIDRDGSLRVAAYFRRMDRVFAVLAGIVARELRGQPLDLDERRFLHQIAQEMAPSYGNTMHFDGWYYDLFFAQERVTYGHGEPDPQFGQSAKPADGIYNDQADYLAPGDLVVDVATAVDEGRGRVSHLGTRPPRYGLFVVDSGGPPRVMVGPVADAYTLNTAWPRRLDDEAARGEPESERHSAWMDGHAPWLRRVVVEPDLFVQAECDELGWYVEAIADKPVRVELRVVDLESGASLRSTARTLGPRRTRITLPRGADPEWPCDGQPTLVVGPITRSFQTEMGFEPVALGRYREATSDGYEPWDERPE